MDRGPPLRRVRILTGLLALLAVLFVAYAVYAYVASPGGGGVAILGADGEPVEQVQGEVVLQRSDGEPAAWTVRHDGEPVASGEGASFRWDSREVSNGVYAIRAEGRPDASAEVTVQNARRELGTTAAVVGATTAVAAGGSAVTSSVASRVTVATAQVAKETLMALGEDHLALRTGRPHRIHWLLALGITLLLVFLFFALEGLRPLVLGEYLEALPIVGTVAAVFVALSLGAEALLALAGRARSQIRFLASGALSLGVSSLVFRTPFGYPGFIDEEDDVDDDGVEDIEPHVEGLRAVAVIGVMLGILLPFRWLGRFEPDIADVATEIAIVSMATSALPLRPLPGIDVWRWHRGLSLFLFLGAYTLYFGYQLGFLPYTWLPVLGVLGLTVYGAVAVFLRARTATPQPPWYVAVTHAAHDARGALSLVSPQGAVRAGRALVRGGARVADGIAGAGAMAGRGLQRLLAPISRIAARWEQRRIDAGRADDERRFLHDAGALLDGLEDIEDEAELFVPDTGHRIVIGRLRADVLRVLMARARRQEGP